MQQENKYDSNSVPDNKVLKHTYCLFLDDFRPPREAYDYTRDVRYLTEKWVCVKDFNEFVQVFDEKLKAGEIPKLVSFDRDLHPEHYEHLDDLKYTEPTGQDCLSYFIKALDKYVLEEIDKVDKTNSAAILDIKIMVHSQSIMAPAMKTIANIWKVKLMKTLKM